MTERWFDDLLMARDRNVALPLSLHPLDHVDEFWRRRMPYRYDGRRHHIVDATACWERGYGACGDAAASLAAAGLVQGRRVQLCIERPPSRPDYLHVRVFVDGIAYDPYSRFRPLGLPPTCEERRDL